MTNITYDETGNVPSDQCETPASDYWQDMVAWQESVSGPESCAYCGNPDTSEYGDGYCSRYCHTHDQ